MVGDLFVGNLQHIRTVNPLSCSRKSASAVKALELNVVHQHMTSEKREAMISLV